jgi:hypothetical protein
MAINYPTSLDSFTNPTATDLLTSPSHAQQHADINDAMEAVQTKLAIGNTVIGTYTAYTPTWTFGVTTGNGTFSSAYATVNKLTHYYGTFTFGSTSAITSGLVTISLPTTPHASITYSSFPGFNSSQVCFYDTSAFLTLYGNAQINSATGARIYVNLANQTYSRLEVLSSTVPFTWATGDLIQWNMTYRTA